MSIDYQVLIDEAMIEVVAKVLKHIQLNGIIDNNSFYISFCTSDPQVKLSPDVRMRYPKEITIILQHQFKDLKILSNKFSVNIAFNGVEETIEVPYKALTGFADPEMNFNIRFKQYSNNIHDNIKAFNKVKSIKTKTPLKVTKDYPLFKDSKTSGKIIAIDGFLNKSK